MALLDEVSYNDNRHGTYKARLIIKDHLDIIKNASDVTSLTGEQQMRYAFNSHGLYKELNIPKRFYLITDLINNINGNVNLEDVSSILVPDTTTLDNLILKSVS